MLYRHDNRDHHSIPGRWGNELNRRSDGVHDTKSNCKNLALFNCAPLTSTGIHNYVNFIFFDVRIYQIPYLPCNHFAEVSAKIQQPTRKCLASNMLTNSGLRYGVARVFARDKPNIQREPNSLPSTHSAAVSLQSRTHRSACKGGRIENREYGDQMYRHRAGLTNR
jgi:hypothetical protein